MRGSVYLGIIALVAPDGAIAAPKGTVRVISLPAQPLAESLQAIAKRYGIELLFAEAVVGNGWAPSVSGRMDVEQVLGLVLAGSPLVVRKIGDGSFIIAVAPVAINDQPVATPDILVIGRRTQNTDIRRTKNDVRPYQVISREDIAASHVATIEELAAKRMPANAQAATYAQQGYNRDGSTASSIDLRGLGTSETLILVDGRRLPMMPATTGFNQSDVNALPPEAIERVEAITATAGGIYGPGATSGVINLVLRRDYRGVDVAVTNGVTARGDAPYRRIDLRLGFTPDHGATDVMVDMAHSTFGGLTVGDRDFEYRANARTLQNNPGYIAVAGPPSSSSITVVSEDRNPLRFKPSFGGATLGSLFTFVAPSDGASPAGLVQNLTANAGKIDPRPSADATGDRQTLLSGRRTTSIIASARHHAGPLELFADFLHLDNEGRARSAYPQNQVTLEANDPTNPFAQQVTVYAPAPAQTQGYVFRSRVIRATGGIIVDLPASWRGEVDYSRGSGESSYVSQGRQLTYDGIVSYAGSLYGGAPRNPLVSYSSYLASFEGLFGDYGSKSTQINHFDDGSIRLAGPILKVGGGNLTATVLAEQRTERVSGGTLYSYSPLVDPGVVENLPSYAQNTRSFYGELRAPLVDGKSGFRLLRGLEVQLAVRHDRMTTQAVQDALSIDGGGTRKVRNSGTVYTGGMKFSPMSGLLVRGSISTGRQPLEVSGLARLTFAGIGVTFNDPKRPGDLETYDEISGGPTHPKPVWARSMSAGIVIQPERIASLRLSVDYTHIAKRGEGVVSLASGDAYFIANEAQYPDRVARLPLTAADAARGYTGGAITQVDSSSLQNGRTLIDAVDALLDYRLGTGRVGSVDLHASATWQPRFRRIVGFGVPSRNFAGASDGAPVVRANAGARWTRGPLTLSVDGQLTGRYRITSAIEFLREIDELFSVVQQGGVHVQAQATLDLAAEYRFTLPGAGGAGRPRTLALRAGIQDALDSRAATVINAYGSYNNYFDPRRRRFELTVAAAF